MSGARTPVGRKSAQRRLGALDDGAVTSGRGSGTGGDKGEMLRRPKLNYGWPRVRGSAAGSGRLSGACAHVAAARRLRGTQ